MRERIIYPLVLLITVAYLFVLVLAVSCGGSLACR